ncbi:hypothetical protein N7510_011785 [Penicillium lagena]|uniref:uncharacterized protein n=1 Tax=Penicillium lagena TaxID=94218 RepID=UPI00253FB0C9|nr:uncharacterized protein N7510_011785 [Penicillium lagena]KAJ5602251.1 hypothetical protein N7510_011785 [Penicillium lagena]
MPGFPVNAASPMLQQDFEDREVLELDFTSTGINIGRFAAYDYFDDGSFYILDTPGHMVGHIYGFARTSVSPSTFILMGGDAAHHAGEFRPSEYLPVSQNIYPFPATESCCSCFPSDLFLSLHPYRSRTKPFYSLTPDFNHNLELANWTIAGLQELDSLNNVWVIIAHDSTLIENVAFFPHNLNNWGNMQ